MTLNVNKTVGEIACPFHDGETVKAEVRHSASKDRFYMLCPQCGLIQPTRASFQRYIEAHGDLNGGDMYGDGTKYEGGGEPEPEEPAEPAKTVQVEPEPQKPKSNLLKRFGKAILEE